MHVHIVVYTSWVAHYIEIWIITYITQWCEVLLFKTSVLVGRENKSIIESCWQLNNDPNEKDDIQPWTGGFDTPLV